MLLNVLYNEADGGGRREVGIIFNGDLGSHFLKARRKIKGLMSIKVIIEEISMNVISEMIPRKCVMRRRKRSG